jgi:DNA-binding SARP family transcriptional activator
MVAVRVLGAVGVEVDGTKRGDERVDRALRVLAWLAVHPGLHERGAVAARLWPDILDSSARASLRSGLWEVRRLLGPAAETALVTTRDRVGLAADGVTVDLRTVAALVAAGRDDDALAIADAPLLPGIEEDWADEARDEHRRTLVELMGRVAHAAAARGDHARAVAVARRRVELDPLSEELHRALLRRLADAGDRGAALAEHERMRRRLLTTLRIAPSQETKLLVAELMREQATPAEQVPGRLRRLERDPFVGRAAELARLGAVWYAKVDALRPRLALLTGEPGIGKTRLAAHLAFHVAESGGAVLYGGCSEDSLVPLEPFAAALQDELGGMPLAELAADVGGAATKVAGIFERIERAISARALGAPTLLVLDDMHWADRLTLSLLTYLLRAPAGDSLVVVCAYRGEELDGSPLASALPALRREADVTELRLTGLREADVRELVADIPGADAQAIHGYTGGNPLYVRELARAVASGDQLTEAVPPAVGELIGRRLERLADGGATLAAASILGESFTPRTLAVATGEPVVSHLDEALARGLVEEANGRFRFVHSLVRNVVSARVGPGRRSELHHRVAEALLTVHGEEQLGPLVEIARHRLAAVPAAGAERAVEVAVRAARRAVELGAYDQAVELYTRALPFVPETAAERRVLLLERARAFTLLWHVTTDAPQLVR